MRRALVGILVCVVLVGSSVLLSASPQDIHPARPELPKAFQTSRAKVVERTGEAILLKGNVELNIDEKTVVRADQAELRHDSKGGYQVLLSGDVRMSLTERPSIKAQYARKMAEDGSIAYRSDVRISLGTEGAKMLADECDYFPASGEFKLRGNVRIERSYEPLQR